MLSYCKRLFLSASGNLTIDNSINLNELVKSLAGKTEGFTGREISKLIISMQASTLSSEDGVLTPKIVDSCLQSALFSHSQKRTWLSNYEKLTFENLPNVDKIIDLKPNSNVNDVVAKSSTATQKITPKSASGARNSVKI